MSNFRLYSVNWQDGMLVARKHLLDEERYVEDLARWYAYPVGERYGLARKSSDGRPALGLTVLVHGARVRVELSRCQAITSDGTVIEINESGPEVLFAEAPLQGDRIDVFLAVNREAKRPVGAPDARELVPRAPFAARDYALHLGEPPALPESDFLQIARLKIAGGDVVQAPDYYPACLSMYATDGAYEKHKEYCNRLESLMAVISRAHLVAATAPPAGGRNELPAGIEALCDRVGAQLAATFDLLALGPAAPHPHEVVVFFKRLFRTVATALAYRPAVKDYLNDRLFSRTLGSSMGAFVSQIDSFLLTEYNHRGLSEHFHAIDAVLRLLQETFSFLAQSDRIAPEPSITETVEYQGRTYAMAATSGLRCEERDGLCYLLVALPAAIPLSDLVVLMAKELFDVSQWNAMQVRLGMNDALGLGQTDPVKVDTVTYGSKVVLRAQDMVRNAAVKQVNLIFRGKGDVRKFRELKPSELLIYTAD